MCIYKQYICLTYIYVYPVAQQRLPTDSTKPIYSLHLPLNGTLRPPKQLPLLSNCEVAVRRGFGCCTILPIPVRFLAILTGDISCSLERRLQRYLRKFIFGRKKREPFA